MVDKLHLLTNCGLGLEHRGLGIKSLALTTKSLITTLFMLALYTTANSHSTHILHRLLLLLLFNGHFPSKLASDGTHLSPPPSCISRREHLRISGIVYGQDANHVTQVPLMSKHRRDHKALTSDLTQPFFIHHRNPNRRCTLPLRQLSRLS